MGNEEKEVVDNSPKISSYMYCGVEVRFIHLPPIDDTPNIEEDDDKRRHSDQDNT
jgi:hypothetical protein